MLLVTDVFSPLADFRKKKTKAEDNFNRDAKLFSQQNNNKRIFLETTVDNVDSDYAKGKIKSKIHINYLKNIFCIRKRLNLEQVTCNLQTAISLYLFNSKTLNTH